MRSSYTVCLACTLLAGCVSTNAAVLDPTVKYQKICPDGVQIFTSARRVSGDYREVALLHSKGESSWTTERGMAGSQRKKAAELGANGIIIGETKEPNAGTKIIGSILGTGSERKGAALAIYVPGDSVRVQRACGIGSTGQLAATTTPSPQGPTVPAALTSTRSNESHSEPAQIATRLAPEEVPSSPTLAVPDSTAIYTALAKVGPGVDEEALSRNPGLQDAMAAARASGIATEFFEEAPGALRVSVAQSFQTVETLEYDLGLLLGAYRRHRPFDQPGIVELWDGDAKIGEYTPAGLKLSEQISPR